MKKLLAMLAIVTQLTAAGIVYPATMQVTDISGDIVTLETATGFVYQMQADDFEKGDLVSLVMFSNGTTNITDDIILTARYSGFYLN